MPKRIQRRRTKGWRMPPNTIDCTRSGKYGNLYKIGDQVFKEEWEQLTDKERLLFNNRTIENAEGAILLFKKFQLPKIDLTPLKGFDLACWCKEDSPCHVDELLMLSNS